MLLVGAHRARRRVPDLPAVQQAPPHRHQLPEHLVPQARAARRAAEDGPRGRERDVRAEDAAGPRLEGPARRLHLHRVRPLPGGLPGLEHRQAAQSQDVHHGHPGHVGRGRARPRPHPELADRARDVRARRRATGRERRWPRRSSTRDPVRRGLGLRDLRRVRRGVPGAHRARRQDRRAAPEPRPRGVAVPAGATAAFRAMEGQGNPWGQPASTRLDWTKPLPFEVPTVAVAGRRRRARRPRGPVLGRLRGGVRSAQPEGRAGGRDVPACRRRRRSRCSARRSRAPATRPGGWATTTCSRSSRRGRSRRSNQYGMGERTIVTACPHCFNTIGNEYGQLGGVVPGRPPLDVPGRARVVRAAGDRAGGRGVVDRRPPAGQRDRPRLVLPRPLQRRHRGAA